MHRKIKICGTDISSYLIFGCAIGSSFLRTYDSAGVCQRSCRHGLTYHQRVLLAVFREVSLEHSALVETKPDLVLAGFYNAQPGAPFDFAHPRFHDTRDIPHILPLRKSIDEGLLRFLNKGFAELFIIFFANMDF